MGMLLLRRLRDLVIVLLVVSTMLFFIVRLLPGDPAQNLLGSNATPELLAQLRAQMGLDGPLWQQYLSWIGRLLTGDFGVSYHSGESVIGMILTRMPMTLQLAVISLVISFVIAVVIVTVNATWPRSRLGKFFVNFSSVGFSLPDFWIALVFVIVFAVTLRWVPTTGVYLLWDPAHPDAVLHLILPVATLCWGQIAQLVLVMRESILGEMNYLYLRTARSKGLSEFVVVLRHVLPNSLLPVITVLGMNFAFLLGGVVIIETVFGAPGLGTLLLNAIQNRDYAVVQGGALVVAGLFVIVNLIVDLAYMWADPKVRVK